MLREELWVRRVRLEGSSAAPVPASITLAAGMAVMTGYEMTCPRAREKMCAVNVSVEAVIASGPETLRNSQVGDHVNSVSTCSRPSVFRHQLRHDLRLPHAGERVLPRPPRPRRLRRRRQRAALPVSRRPLAHPGRRRGRRQRLPRHPFLAQSPHLGIRDQPVLHKENGQSHTTLGGSTNRPIASSATGKNNCR